MGKLYSRVYQYAFQYLGEAFTRFLQGTSEYPKFKKKWHHDSFTLEASGRYFRLGGIRHKLPFVGWVRTKEALPECPVSKVTISRQTSDWYLSFFIESDPQPVAKQRDRIGVDVGINALATCSDGTVFPNLKPYRRASKRLKRLMRALSRKRPGSKNRHKARIKLAFSRSASCFYPTQRAPPAHLLVGQKPRHNRDRGAKRARHAEESQTRQCDCRCGFL